MAIFGFKTLALLTCLFRWIIASQVRLNRRTVEPDASDTGQDFIDDLNGDTLEDARTVRRSVAEAMDGSLFDDDEEDQFGILTTTNASRDVSAARGEKIVSGEGGLPPHGRNSAKDHRWSCHKCLVMNHFPKAAGTFVRAVMLVSVREWKWEREGDSVSTTDRSDGNFVIGLVRNPFDWYLSLWAWLVRMRRLPKNFLPLNIPEEGRVRRDLGETKDDRYKFHKFLRALLNETYWSARENSPQDTNFNWTVAKQSLPVETMSSRFFKTYLSVGFPNVSNGSVNYSNYDPKIYHAWGQFQPDKSGDVSCWVRAENAVPDLRRCLHRYENERGVQVVDWDLFHQAVNKVRHNPSEHAPCEEMYGQDAIDLVKKAEAPIVTLFGYQWQCQQRPLPFLTTDAYQHWGP